MYIVENYLLHMNTVIGHADKSRGSRLRVVARTTIHEVDINYTATAEQFIGVIIVYRHFRRPQRARNFPEIPDDPIDHYCTPLFRFINNACTAAKIISHAISLARLPYARRINCRTKHV